MIVGVPKESYPGERRVALVPAVIPTLAKAGLEVVVESGAGEGAGYSDSIYIDKGGKLLPDRAAAQSSNLPDTVDAYGIVFDQWVKDYEPKTAILVVRRSGKTVFAKGYGADPHEFPRSTEADMDMKSEFLKPDGAVVDTCGGRPCATRGFDPAP